MKKTRKTGSGPRKIGDYLSCDPKRIESALILQRSLQASGEPCRLGAILVKEGDISKEALASALVRQRLDRIRRCILFEGLMDDDLRIIGTFTVEAGFAEDEEFIVQDSPGNCFYLLVSGRAFVYRRDEYGEQTPICLVKPGESIGEMGYFSDGTRLASVKALEPSQCLKISYADLDRIFEAVPVLARTFLSMITGRLRQTNLRFERSMTRTRRTEKYLENIHELLDMSDAMSLKKGIEDQIERIVKTARKTMNAERATLFLLDTYTGELWSMLAEGMTSREIRIPKDQGLVGWVVRHQMTANIPDAYGDCRFDPVVDSKTGYRTRSILCGPLKNNQGELVGALQVINKKSGTFDRTDESFFTAFTYQTAIAVENLQLYKRLLNDHRKMATVFDVATGVAHTLDLDTLFVDIVARITDALRAERSSLFLLDRDAGELWAKVAQKSELNEIRFSVEQGLAGYVARTGTRLNITNAYDDPRFLAGVDEQTGFVTHSVLSVPIINRDGDIIGVAQAINKVGGVFDNDDEDLLTALSSHIAIALENARLFAGTEEMKQYLTSVQESISNAIVTLDGQGRVVTMNRAALSMIACPPPDSGTTTLRDLLGPDNQGLIRDIETVYRSGHSSSFFDTDLLFPSGAAHSVNGTIVPLIDAAGDRTGTVLVLDDITREKRMKGTLVRYMAKDIVEKILEDPRQQVLGGNRSKATILFSDIRGYTGISENLTAEETVALLNEYFSLMVNEIFENEGVLDKYMGDGLMSVFGVPYPRKDDAERAVRTALSMHRALGGLNARRKSGGQEPIRIGIGISTGEVVSGNIGSERRMEYTVIGDGVNVASRIEKLTKHFGTGILISEFTCRELGEVFAVRPVDRVQVRGRKQPMDLFEVLGEAGTDFSPSQHLFMEGLARYRSGDFTEAALLFDRGRDDDPLCRVFFDRCERLIEQTPKGWDGVWVSPY
ncbi:hypothetical protein JCM14469_26170 [Desulfatiferula olefinivorans]